MRWLKTIVAEIFGLFVDDGGFSLTILIWLAAAWWVLPRLGVSTTWRGIVLFAGLALILAESTTRSSRK